MITKDKWIVMRENLGMGHAGRIIITTQERVDKNQAMIAKDIIDEANARLIAAACNACQEINPDNPQAAAEALVDLYEACKGLFSVVQYYHSAKDPTKAAASIEEIYIKAEQALSKAEAKQ